MACSYVVCHAPMLRSRAPLHQIFLGLLIMPTLFDLENHIQGVNTIDLSLTALTLIGAHS